MNERLRLTVDDLTRQGIPHRVIDLGEPTRRTRDVIARRDIDVDPQQIVKTILFKSKIHGVFSVAVQGHDRISYPKIKQVMGDKNISTLRPEEMRELGWEPGECCPLTVPGPLYVDPTVLSHDRINTGSGDLHHGLEFPPETLLVLRGDATICDVREYVNPPK